MAPEDILRLRYGARVYIANTPYNNLEDILRLLPIAEENGGLLIINDAGLSQQDIVTIIQQGSNLLILDDEHLSNNAIRALRNMGVNIVLNLDRPDYLFLLSG